MISCVFVFVALCLVDVSLGGCPPGFPVHGPFCDGLDQTPPTAWWGSESTCADLDGVLTEIFGDGGNTYVKKVVSTKNRLFVSFGGQDRFKRGTWVWKNGTWIRADETKGCPPGFKAYGAHCYSLAKKPMDWTDAQSTCAAVGGYLAEIFDEGENEFIREMTLNNSFVAVWIGGNNFFPGGNWTWSKSGTLFTKYSDWAPGQPDNSNKLGDENCLDISFKQRGHWNDDVCSIKYPFVCQLSLESD